MADPVVYWDEDAEGGRGEVEVTPQTPLPVREGKPAAADVIHGRVSHVATTAAATIVTVPAGRTFVGEVVVACDVANAAANAVAGQALGVISVAGAGATPAPGPVAACEARCGANGATGAVGSQGHNAIAVPLIVVAAAAAVDIQVASTIAGSAGRVEAMVAGRLLP